MKEIFQKVTNELIANLKEIEAGKREPKWFKPWTASGFPSMPTNLITGNRYRGANALVLYMTAINCGYRTNQWLTFKQKNQYNSEHESELMIVKGSHGYPIFKYVEWVPKEYQAVDGGGFVSTVTGEMKENPKAIALRQYTVFNVDQMDNVPADLLPGSEPPDWDATYKRAHEAVKNFPCEVRHGGTDMAYYKPGSHFIMMPEMAQFEREVDYLATLFHEHVHSTGPVLERDMTGVMGDASYAKEELVAEIGSALLCAEFGIEAPMQHPEYINMYITQLEYHDRAFWNAANLAQKAVDHLLKVEVQK